jgi:hypothetical protein
MSAENMESRFFLVVAMCFSALVGLVGNSREASVIVERMSTHQRIPDNSPFSQFLDPKLLKKFNKIEYSLVQGRICRFLSAIALHLPGNSHTSLIPDLARQHIDEYSRYIQKSISASYFPLNDTMNLLIAASTSKPPIILT